MICVSKVCPLCTHTALCVFHVAMVWFCCIVVFCFVLLQAMLEEFSLCYSGNFLPALTPQALLAPRQREGATEDEEKDADILQRDIIAVCCLTLVYFSLLTPPPSTPPSSLLSLLTSFSSYHPPPPPPSFSFFPPLPATIPSSIVSCFHVWILSTQGYLRMNFLPRARYILEVLFPQGPLKVHKELLEVVTRIARHSMAAATQVCSP